MQNISELFNDRKVNSPSISSGTLTLDLSTGRFFNVSLTENVTTLAFSNVPSGVAVSVCLSLTQDSTGGRTVEWPWNILWESGPSVVKPKPGDTTTVTLTSTNGGATWVDTQEKSNKSAAEYPDPANLWFPPSGVVVDTVSSQICGDPFIVWDGTQWVMFLFRTLAGAPPYVTTYRRTAPTLEGPWSSATEVTGLSTYHKFVVLVDEYGSPVRYGGSYHGYAALYTGSSSSKEIFYFTASSLTGSWTMQSKVIAKGTSGSLDEYNTDTPYAIMKNGKVYLWYMGAPASSQPTYGYAIRMLRAYASSPGGSFTKEYADVLLPSTSSAWDYGWLGGVQIRRRPNGKYMMVYNAGDTRPSSAGAGPNVSRVGYAYADSINGPWTKDLANPYFTPTGWPSNGVESTNIWRAHLAYDNAIGNWYAFYNTGAGTEKITFGRAGSYNYYDTTDPESTGAYPVLTLSTSVQTIPRSRVNLTPGTYRVRYAYNVGDLSTTKPALDVDLVLRINGSAAFPPSREFVGSYNYENRDVVMEYIISVSGNSYIDATAQVTGGTPTSNSLVRRQRITVERKTAW